MKFLLEKRECNQGSEELKNPTESYKAVCKIMLLQSFIKTFVTVAKVITPGNNKKRLSKKENMIHTSIQTPAEASSFRSTEDNIAPQTSEDT